MTRPAFAEKYPENDALDALVERFEAGDYAAVREGAKELERAEKEVRDAARDLVSRTEPAPMMKWLFLAVLVTIAIVTAYWAVHSRIAKS